MPKFTLTIECDTKEDLAAFINPKVVPAMPELPMVQTKVPVTVTANTGSGDALISTDPSIPTGVDTSGVTWDARIHSSSKAMNKDGTWRYMRSVDKDLIDQVEQAQIDAAGGTPVEPEEQSALGQVIEQAQQAASNPFPPLPGEEVPTPMNDTPVEFGDFMAIFSPLAQSGEFDQSDVNLLCEQVGVESIADLAVQADKVGPAVDYLNHVIAERAK